MIDKSIEELLNTSGLLNTEHVISFRFFQRTDVKQLIVSSIEISHLGKSFRFFNTLQEIQKMFKLNQHKVKLSLDAIDNLNNFFMSNNYSLSKEEYNNWAEYQLIYSKSIDITKIDVELKRFFLYYYNLCLDYNIGINSLDS